jgi:hypothetical protein
MGPQNILLGGSYGIDLPETEIDKDQLVEERQMAKFSRTKEFKRLKEQMQSRIAFYQSVLPDGRPLTDVDLQERAQQWVIANVVIGEFQRIIDMYEVAATVTADKVKNG